MGLCVARALLMRGQEVSLFDREPASGTMNCSLGNAGMVVPSHFIPLAAPGMVAKGLRMWWREPEGPLALRLSADPALLGWMLRFMRACSPAHVARCARPLLELGLESRRLFEEASAASGNAFGFTPRGLLMLCRTREALDEEARTAAMARELGLPAEVLDPAGLAAADPDVTLSAAGGVLYPQDAHLSPEAFLDWLMQDVIRRGGDVHHRMDLVRLEARGSRVTTARFRTATVDCEEVVMAGGVWSGSLLATLGIGLPLQPGKGYSLTLDTPPQVPRLCSILVEGKVAVTPMGGRLRLAGTLELGRWDGTVDPARMRGIYKTARAFLPKLEGVDLESEPVWVGHRPCSPDGLPYVGRWPSLENLTIATGHAMMGLSLAPVTGSLVAQAVDGESSPLLDLLRPDRFG